MLLDNSGVFVATWFILLIILLSFYLAGKLFRCCQKASKTVIKCFVWSPILRTFIETFLELGLCSTVNLLNVLILLTLSFLLSP